MEQNVIKTFTAMYGDNTQVTIKIYQDFDAENPREQENLGVILVNKNRYLNNEGPDISTLNLRLTKYSRYGQIQESKEWICFSLYLYSHSGERISLSPFACPWDSGQIGWYGFRKKHICNEFGKKYFTQKMRNKTTEIANYEIKTLDKYFTGDVFMFVVYEGEEDIESSYGHYYDYNQFVEMLTDNGFTNIEEIEE
jgi:hypothetical protein